MAEITFKGKPIHTNGDLPTVGARAPAFTLVDVKLKDVSLSDLGRKRKLLNIVPSLDTGVCATSAKKFNEFAKDYKDAVIVTISADLPFAQSRFCSAEGVDNVLTLSLMRSNAFATDYGVLVQDGPLAGLAARAIVVLDEDNNVLYNELVPEIAQEPDYERALAALA